MRPDDAGLPGHAFAQLFDSDLLGPEAIAVLRDLLTRESITAEMLVRPGYQVPLRWFQLAFPGLDADQAAYLGWMAGQQARVTSYGLLSVPLMSAGSVSQIVRLLDFLPLISNVLSAQAEHDPDGVQITLAAHSGDPVLDRFPITYAGAALLQLVTLLVDEPSDMTVAVAWPTPPQLHDHPAVVSGQLRFEADAHCIRVPTTTLDAVCRFSDPVAYEHAVRELQRALDTALAAQPMTSMVRRSLGEHPRLGPSTVVADHLQVSVSTLKRRLQAEGTTFREILETSLHQRATTLLENPDLSLAAIATELGYSDAANFAHAFKRWTGKSPGECRSQAPRNR